MYHFYFDASALVKRYTEEIGSDKVDYLFVNAPLNQLKCLTLGAAEVFWICVRKKNDGRITPYEFTHAVTNLNREVISDASNFRTDSVPDALVWASLNLVETYSLNSVDAIVLRSALETVTELRRTDDTMILVASDQRLLRAASSEGLLVFNPVSREAVYPSLLRHNPNCGNWFSFVSIVNQETGV
ncbi:MAG: type II toxin-antitoxin system VapC family toxin [Candidatus Poribacteria bacterium]|nr:type II toxin-antitoxin system VapC family toxin [Candidatus Poribacteria bacterium]